MMLRKLSEEQQGVLLQQVRGCIKRAEEWAERGGLDPYSHLLGGLQGVLNQLCDGVDDLFRESKL